MSRRFAQKAKKGVVFCRIFPHFSFFYFDNRKKYQKITEFFVKITQKLLQFLCNAIIIGIGYCSLNVQNDYDVE